MGGPGGAGADQPSGVVARGEQIAVDSDGACGRLRAQQVRAVRVRGKVAAVGAMRSAGRSG
jgi:hypothetical protein